MVLLESPERSAAISRTPSRDSFSESTSDSMERPSARRHWLCRYLTHIRAKLEQPPAEDVEEHIRQGNLLLRNVSGHSDASGHFYQALNSPDANGIAIADALSGALAATKFDRQHLPDYERVLSGYHYMFGTEDIDYLEVAAEVCQVASSTERASEFLPLFRRVVPQLLSRATEVGDLEDLGPLILFAGMEYLKSQLLTVDEIQTLSADVWACMDSHGHFAAGYQMLFELNYVYGHDMGLFDEADKCLVQALDIACSCEDFFKYKSHEKLLFHLSLCEWRGDNPPPSFSHSNFSFLEKGLRAHQNDAGIGESEVSCWIYLAIMFTRIGSNADAKRVLEDVRTALQKSPARSVNEIWEMNEPYRGLRAIWEVCLETGPLTIGEVGLAEAVMSVVLEALTKWHESSCPQAQDAALALESLRSRYDI